MRSRRRRFGIIVVAAGVLAACGSTTTPTPANPYDGTWVGQTAAGELVQLKIQGSQIVAFELDADVSGSAFNCSIPVKGTVSAPIVDKGFSLSLTPSFPSITPLTVAGQFDSFVHVAGTYTSFTITDICGPGVVVKPAGTFTARQ